MLIDCSGTPHWLVAVWLRPFRLCIEILWLKTRLYWCHHPFCTRIALILLDLDTPRREKQELEIARINLLPMLQAEADRRYIRQRKQQVEEEEKIMEGVEGWVVGESVYKTRWMPPTSVDPVHKL